MDTNNNQNNSSNSFFAPLNAGNNDKKEDTVYQAPIFKMDNDTNNQNSSFFNDRNIEDTIPVSEPVVDVQNVEPIKKQEVPSFNQPEPITEPVVNTQASSFFNDRKIEDVKPNPIPVTDVPKVEPKVPEPVVEESKKSFVQPSVIEKSIEQDIPNNIKPKSFMPGFDVSIDDKRRTIEEFNKEDDVKSQTTINNLMSNNSTNLYQSGPKVYAVEKPKTNIPVVIVLTVIVLVVAGYFAFAFIDTATKKMVCESNMGTISITYNKTTIVGYKSNKITYNLYEQRTYADEVGIKQYLDEFEQWFQENTQGTCKR